MQNYRPSLDQFIIIADEANITHAAKRLNVSQQSLTGYLARLEKYYGVTLFDRGYRRMTLTSYGRKVYDAAIQIQQIHNQLYEARPLIENSDKLQIRIGCMRPHASSLLKEIPISAFTESHPSVRFSIHEANSSQLKQMLMDQQLDVIIVYQKSDLSNREYCGVDLFSSDVLLMVSDVILENCFPGLNEKTLNSWKNSGIDLKEFTDVPMILPPSQSYVRRFVTEYLEKNSLKFSQLTECEDYSLMQHLASSNLGACLISASLNNIKYRGKNDSQMHYLPIRQPDLARRVTVYFRRSAGQDFRIMDFIRVVKNTFKE
ncbi:MAG: LysR family transcriptional regulator [Clostridiales bacterium]|nr:LysR family transcriptional regulator [Clostridiales bacterium]